MAEEQDELIPPQDPEAPSHLDNLFQVITNRYRPAASFHDADLKLSTTDIFDQLQELCPSPGYTAKDVFDALFQSNFKIDDLGDMKFVWLLSKKKSIHI